MQNSDYLKEGTPALLFLLWRSRQQLTEFEIWLREYYQTWAGLYNITSFYEDLETK